MIANSHQVEKAVAIHPPNERWTDGRMLQQKRKTLNRQNCSKKKNTHYGGKVAELAQGADTEKLQQSRGRLVAEWRDGRAGGRIVQASGRVWRRNNYQMATR